MNDISFTNLVESAFRPFLAELGFSTQSLNVSGSYYSATFVGSRYTLLITFELEDEHTAVMLFTNGDSDLKSIDDPHKTPRLADLNAKYMSQVSAEARSQNETYFSPFKAADSTEKMILKCAKDLRLVLPLHLGRGLHDG